MLCLGMEDMTVSMEFVCEWIWLRQCWRLGSCGWVTRASRLGREGGEMCCDVEVEEVELKEEERSL